jgi:hypothetical protein
MESLDEHVDEDAEAARADEIARRLKEVDSSTVATIPWAEGRRWILGEGTHAVIEGAEARAWYASEVQLPPRPS